MSCHIAQTQSRCSQAKPGSLPHRQRSVDRLWLRPGLARCRSDPRDTRPHEKARCCGGQHHVFGARGTTVFLTAPFELSGSSPLRERGCESGQSNKGLAAQQRIPAQDQSAHQAIAAGSVDRGPHLPLRRFDQLILAIAIALSSAATEFGRPLGGQGVH